MARRDYIERTLRTLSATSPSRKRLARELDTLRAAILARLA